MTPGRLLKLLFVLAAAYFSQPLLVLSGVTFQAADGNLPLGMLLNATLIFHEAGHWILSPLGQFLMVCGGSIMQLLVPLVCLIAFWRKEEKFGAGFSLYWLGVSGINLSYYISDARAQQLELISRDTLHDWHFILDRMNLLNSDVAIGHGVYFASLVIGIVGLGVMAWGALDKDNETPIPWE